MNRRTTPRDASNNFADRILALDAAVRALYEFRKFHLFSRALRRIGEEIPSRATNAIRSEAYSRVVRYRAIK